MYFTVSPSVQTFILFHTGEAVKYKRFALQKEANDLSNSFSKISFRRTIL